MVSAIDASKEKRFKSLVFLSNIPSDRFDYNILSRRFPIEEEGLTLRVKPSLSFGLLA